MPLVQVGLACFKNQSFHLSLTRLDLSEVRRQYGVACFLLLCFLFYVVSIVSHSSSARGDALQMGIGLTHFSVGLVAKSIHAVTSVQLGSDLLVSLDKTLEFSVDFNVLTGKHIAMVLKGVDLSSEVLVLSGHGLGSESEVILLPSGNARVIVSCTALGF